MTDPRSVDLVQQMVPGYNPDESLRKNLWDLTGYTDPSGVLAPAEPASITPGVGTVEAPNAANRGYTNEVEALDEEYLRTSGALSNSTATREDTKAVLERSFYETESFLDQIGTALQVNSAYYLNQWNWLPFNEVLSREAGRDIQSGFVGESTRPGSGLYVDSYTPEEMYGEGWRALSKEELFRRREQFRLKQVEQFYGHVDTSESAARWIGWGAAHLFEPSVLLPTGAIGLAAKLTKAGLMGKTAAASTAGAITTAAWSTAATALDQYVVEQELDPARMEMAAVLGGVVGGLLPLVGGLLTKLWTKHRRTGVHTDPSDVAAVADLELDTLNKKINDLENRPLSTNPEEASQAARTLDRLKEQRDATMEVRSKSKEIAKTMSAADNSSPETDAASIYDDAKRLQEGTSTRSMDYLKIINKIDRKKPGYSPDDIKNTKLYSQLDAEEQALIDDHLARLNDQPVKKKKKKEKKPSAAQVTAQAREKAQEEAAMRINEEMRVFANQGDKYKYNLRQHITHTGAMFGAGYGTGYAVEGDHDRALYWGLSAGAITLGAPVGRRLYGWSTSGKHLLDADDVATRTQANLDMQSNFIKSFLSGLHDITNNNYTTVPIRQWENRGGAGRYLAGLFRKADENYKHAIAGDMVEFGHVMAKHNIGAKETGIVQKLMRHTIERDAPGVLEKHRKAADDMRHIYNAQVQRSVKLGIMDQAAANALKDTAKIEGYLNRVYDTDFLRSKKGRELFVQRMMQVGKDPDTGKGGITKDEAASIVQALTGEKRANVLKSLHTTATKGADGYYTFSYDGLMRLAKDSHKGLAQPSQFLERERTIPTRLEKVLEPFLVDDLAISYTKYSESLNRRYAYAKEFGAKNEKMTAIADQIDVEMGRNLGHQAYMDLQGALFNPENDWIKRYFNAPDAFRWSNNIVQHAQNAKLLLSGPLNFTQHLIYLPAQMMAMGVKPSKAFTAMRKAYVESAKEIHTEMTRRGRAGAQYVNRMGVLSDAITFSATGDIAAKQAHGSKMGQFYGMVKSPDIWLKMGFEQAESWNRRVAGHAGKALVDDSLERRAYLKSLGNLSKSQEKEVNEINALLTELGINPKTAPADLTLAQLEAAGDVAGLVLRDVNAPGAKDIAGLKLSNLTNFQAGYLHKPRVWNTPVGMWFGKFRNFMLHNTHFVKESVIKPLTYGNAMPLAVFLTSAGIAGPIVAEIKDIMMNDNPDYSNLRMLIEGWMLAGVGGAYAEIIEQLRTHPGNFISFLAGPVFSDSFKAAKTVFQTGVGEGDVAALAEDLTAMLAPAKYAGSLYGRATDQDNPLRRKEERYEEEKLEALGF